VTLFLAKLGLAEAPKRRDQSKQHLPKAKAQERAKANAAAEAAAAETPAE
jgi:small subunit ribosomal protein S16